MKPYRKILRWTPRVMFIIAILFVSMFALDAFSPEMTFWQNLAGFLIHLIPTFVLIAVLIVAWKWELLGGILSTVMGLALTPVIFNFNNRPGNTVGQTLGIALMVTLPFIVAGILFLVSQYVNKSHRTDEQQP